MKRIPLKGGDEHDAFSKRGRRGNKHLARRGVTRWIKRKYNRRFRRMARLAIYQRT